MPSFVVTASVYVDNVATPTHATTVIEALNEHLRSHGDRIQIRLPDNVHLDEPDPRESHWERSGDEA